MKLDFADYRVTIAIVSVDLRAGYVRLSATASCLMNIDVDQGGISWCLSTARSTLRHARFAQAVIDLLLYPISYALCVRKGHPLVEASREKDEVTLDMLRHWRKITVTNREQNRLEVYCMDETTVLGEALQETAVTVPYFLAVPSLLNPRTSRPSCPCRRQDSLRNGTASSPFPFIPIPKATAAGAPSTPISSGTNASPTNPPCSGCADSSRSTPTGRIRRRRPAHKSTLRLRTKTRTPARNKDKNEAAPIQREPGRLPFFQAQALQTGQDLRSST